MAISKDDVRTAVVHYEEEPDIGIVSYGDAVAVSISMTGPGRYIVNIERTGDNRADVEVTIGGDEPIWEGVLP
jgi:hypothetical protein